MRSRRSSVLASSSRTSAATAAVTEWGPPLRRHPDAKRRPFEAGAPTDEGAQCPKAESCRAVAAERPASRLGSLSALRRGRHGRSPRHRGFVGHGSKSVPCPRCITGETWSKVQRVVRAGSGTRRANRPARRRRAGDSRQAGAHLCCSCCVVGIALAIIAWTVRGLLEERDDEP